jgi:hypothetical protein
MARIFAFALLICASVSGHGFVLCWGHDDHMHIEATFNGVDCGHFPFQSVKENHNQYLTMDALFSAAPCYSCTDIPLSFPHYLSEKNVYTKYPDNEKKPITIAALPFPSFQFTLQGFRPDGLLNVPLQTPGTISQILSNTLRL